MPSTIAPAKHLINFQLHATPYNSAAPVRLFEHPCSKQEPLQATSAFCASDSAPEAPVPRTNARVSVTQH